MRYDDKLSIQTPQPEPGKIAFDIEILIDRTSVEIFINKGQMVFVKALPEPKEKSGLKINGPKDQTKIYAFKVHELKSAW